MSSLARRLVVAMGLALMPSVAAQLVAGCGDRCSPDPFPPAEPSYVFENVLSDTWVLESGRVEVFDDQLVITYETEDGAQWEVVYRAIPPGDEG